MRSFVFLIPLKTIQFCLFPDYIVLLIATKNKFQCVICILLPRVKKIVSSCGDHLYRSVQSKVGGCITKALDELKKHKETMKKIIEGAATIALLLM